MSQETLKKEGIMSNETKWFAIGFLVWFAILCVGVAVRDANIASCKVAAINKGMTAAEVAVACKP